MTLDYGIDLIALRMEHDNKITSVVSIQVKTTATLFKEEWKTGRLLVAVPEKIARRSHRLRGGG